MQVLRHEEDVERVERAEAQHRDRDPDEQRRKDAPKRSQENKAGTQLD